MNGVLLHQGFNLGVNVERGIAAVKQRQMLRFDAFTPSRVNGGEALKIKQLGIRQMLWHDVLQTAEHGLDTTRKLFVPVLQHASYDGPLQVRL